MRLIGWLLSSLILLLVIAAVGVFAAASYFGRDLPDTAQLAEYAPPITTFMPRSRICAAARRAAAHTG